MSEINNKKELSTVKKALVLALGAAGLLKLGAVIEHRMDNDRMFQPIPAESSSTVDTTETSIDQDTVALHIQPGDTAYDLARTIVGEDAEWRGVADKIMEASRALGHDQLQPGDILMVNL